MDQNQMAEIPDVDNVYLYVGDAVRWDHRPQSVDRQGLTVKTVSASTHSPTSFASILSGRYPASHGVDVFENRIDESATTLLNLNTTAAFVNSIFEYATKMFDGYDPIFDVLRTQPPDRSVEELFESDSFVVIERGPGGHAPYGESDGTAPEYFERVGGQGSDRFVEDYKTSIDLDAELFEQRLDRLEQLGLRDDTLVIYASDHGELLGEAGCVGHNSPMHPALVYTPTTFIHPDIEPGTLDEPIHHVDIAPTILSAIGQGGEFSTDGEDIASGIPSTPRPCVYRKTFPVPIPNLSAAYQYRGAWDAHGGRVFAECSRTERLAALVGLSIKSPKRDFVRRSLPRSIPAHWPDQTTFGTPEFSTDAAIEAIEAAEQTRVDRDRRQLSESARGKLADLGYVHD